MSLATSSSRRQFLGYTGAGGLGVIPGCRWLQDQGQTGAQAVAQGFGQHKLPDLPYAYDALEPHVDKQTMRLHHQKHHGGALRGLNRTELALGELANKGDFSDSRKLCGALAYYGSSHVLHSIFWTNMKPKGGGAPEGELAKRLQHDFGSLAAFNGLFLAASNSAPAAGWGMLAYHPGFDRLLVLQVEDHEKLTLWGVVPLLVCDVWEHAYYLKYQNRRKEWTSTFLEHLVNWEDVGQRLTAAR